MLLQRLWPFLIRFKTDHILLGRSKPGSLLAIVHAFHSVRYITLSFANKNIKAFEISIRKFSFVENKTISGINLSENEIQTKN